ncbi:hypothetical protein HUJ04_002406 [Dendroctonus ponderosae]|nr:hypothetical protein HUJ04_002406 [Dendroctonus ponderosae]KAH1024679.1 hypothetical protein HUJ05_004131 [Dendroctonus ponderosae]
MVFILIIGPVTDFPKGFKCLVAQNPLTHVLRIVRVFGVFWKFSVCHVANQDDCLKKTDCLIDSSEIRASKAALDGN